MQKTIANTPYKKQLKIWPSHYFNPVHFTGVTYDGPDQPYAIQMWGSTTKSKTPY